VRSIDANLKLSPTRILVAIFRRRLFNRDNEDNLVVEEQQKLANWGGLSADEQEQVLKDCMEAGGDDRAAAVDLLVRCLQRDPKQRPSIKDVLEMEFISGINASILRIERKLDGAHDKLDGAHVKLDDAHEKLEVLDEKVDRLREGSVCARTKSTITSLTRT
jgi:serine/threonine protein kinase